MLTHQENRELVMEQNLSHKQKMVIAEFVKTGQVETVCQQTGISRETYYQWLKNPEFKQELQTQQDALYKTTLSTMKNLFTEAVETQKSLLKSEDERIRLRASNAIIHNIVKIIEMDEMKQRLNDIEERVEFENRIKNEFKEKEGELTIYKNK